MSDYENRRQMEIGERQWTAPPEEKPPLPLSPSDTTRLAENELDYIAQTLHDEFGYSSDWTETDTAVEIRAILEEMLEMLPGGKNEREAEERSLPHGALEGPGEAEGRGRDDVVHHEDDQAAGGGGGRPPEGTRLERIASLDPDQRKRFDASEGLKQLVEAETHLCSASLHLDNASFALRHQSAYPTMGFEQATERLRKEIGGLREALRHYQKMLQGRIVGVNLHTPYEEVAFGEDE